jgi:hypothetical protein
MSDSCVRGYSKNLSKNSAGSLQLGILPGDRDHVPGAEAHILPGFDVRAEARTYLRSNYDGNAKEISEYLDRF